MKKRIIKFRFWDQFNECYTYSDQQPSLYAFFNLYEATARGDCQPILEQFTGLSDRKKTEIYEGDILGRAYTLEEGFYDHMVVRWYSTGELNIKPSAYLMECEVLGNMHQAAEILT